MGYSNDDTYAFAQVLDNSGRYDLENRLFLDLYDEMDGDYWKTRDAFADRFLDEIRDMVESYNESVGERERIDWANVDPDDFLDRAVSEYSPVTAVISNEAGAKEILETLKGDLWENLSERLYVDFDISIDSGDLKRQLEGKARGARLENGLGVVVNEWGDETSFEALLDEKSCFAWLDNRFDEKGIRDFAEKCREYSGLANALVAAGGDWSAAGFRTRQMEWISENRSFDGFVRDVQACGEGPLFRELGKMEAYRGMPALERAKKGMRP